MEHNVDTNTLAQALARELAPSMATVFERAARIEALGNSMAVPCMRWIGERIRLEARRVGITDSAPLPLLAMGVGA